MSDEEWSVGWIRKLVINRLSDGWGVNEEVDEVSGVFGARYEESMGN